MKYTIPCLFGLEALVADELRRLDLKNVRAENGRVHCDGGPADIPRLNINLRCGARVLVELASFPAPDFEALFQGVAAIPWEDCIPRDGEFPVKGYSISSQLHSVPACQAIVKKAEERARRIEEAKLNKGKKKKTEKKHDEDEDKIPGSVKEHSRVGLRQYARGRAYDPYRYSEEGPTAYPGEAPIFPPRSDSRALKREAHEIEEELREIHTDEAIEDAILEEKALEAPVQEETEVVSAGEESEAEDDTDKTKE